MNAVQELEQLRDKESWATEDCARIQALFLELNDPASKFRQMIADLAAANPDASGAAAVKLGIGRYLLCQFAEAADLLAAGTDNKERRFYQALTCKALRQYDRALENLDYAEDRGWDPRQVTLLRVEVHCLAGDADAAAKALDRFAKSSQDDPDWHAMAGMVAEMRGEYEDAVAEYEAARRLSPAHPAATFRLAYYLDLHGDEEAAIDLYRECITRLAPGEGEPPREPRPIYANALVNLAVLHEDAGAYDEAERCLRRVLAANPNHLRARLFLKDIVSSRTMVFDEDEAKRIAKRNDLLRIPVTDFELSVRARNCLKKMNIRTLGDLLHVTESELLSYKNFGETSLAEIKQMLASKGLRLGQMREEGELELTFDTIPTVPSAANVGNEGILATPLAQVEFSVRARRALDRLGLRTLGDLAGKTEAELLACRNFGQTSLNEVVQRLGEYGLNLRESS